MFEICTVRCSSMQRASNAFFLKVGQNFSYSTTLLLRLSTSYPPLTHSASPSTDLSQHTQLSLSFTPSGSASLSSTDRRNDKRLIQLNSSSFLLLLQSNCSPDTLEEIKNEKKRFSRSYARPTQP